MGKNFKKGALLYIRGKNKKTAVLQSFSYFLPRKAVLMYEELLREYIKDNRHFANYEFKGMVREYMIEFRANNKDKRRLFKKRKNNSIKTK